ncbi:LysR substrate-binding domain-containing protein [Veronia pacifica]|uniref:HTH lysR-type domain-containing protein n=1 Tax=Veronia pacifica TaxID=1080227 RepID=A0A1C3EPJ4_9GAMM|nr:LysR substrate-binding domain-containing protein [Veronia pacifica]ODA35129.1 hypothetical protein A8L45_05505 [Veronia pacifica]
MKPRRLTPPLIALRAFEASARYQSFAKAAEELSVTPGAVSQQVALLEDKLGLQLFERIKQRLRLTPAGEQYLLPLKESFDKIETATLDLLTHGGSKGQIKLGVLPTVATYWLIPKLTEFFERHPEVDLQMVSLELNFVLADRSPDLEGELIDIGLFYGDGQWQNLESEKVLEERIIAVASPKLIGKYSPNESFLTLPLLQHSTRPQTWSPWCQQMKMAELKPSGPSFEHFFMLKQAAISSLGIALLPDVMVQNELQRRELMQVGTNFMIASGAYYLVYKKEKPYQPSIKAFRNWVMQTDQTPYNDAE